MVEVEFQANYMLAYVGDTKLYADVGDRFADLDSVEYDETIYPILKEEIINQAKEEGIDPSILHFWWD